MELNAENKKKKNLKIPVSLMQKKIPSWLHLQLSAFQTRQASNKSIIWFCPLETILCASEQSKKGTFLLEQFRLYFTRNQLALLPVSLFIRASAESW